MSYNIGLDAKRAFYNFRGLGNYSRSLIEGLQEFFPEHQYSLFGPAPKDLRGRDWLEKQPLAKAVFPETFFDKKLPSLWRSVFLTNDLIKYDLDLYHGLSHELPPKIEKTSIKSVVTIHDLIYLRHPEFFPWIDRKVYHHKFQSSCKRADSIIAICEQTKRDLIDYFRIDEKKIKVIYQTCNPIFYQQLQSESIESVLKKNNIKENYILYVGALVKRKNALSLVKAYDKSKDKLNHQLVLIGNGKEYKREIESYIKENNLKDKIMILENISLSDLPAFYQGASFFVYPSFFEGFGIPIIEALFSGTPVITSKGSCFPEAGGEHSAYIDPHSIDELASKLIELADSSDLRIEMSKKGKEFVQKFNHREVSENLMEHYQFLLREIK